MTLGQFAARAGRRGATGIAIAGTAVLAGLALSSCGGQASPAAAARAVAKPVARRPSAGSHRIVAAARRGPGTGLPSPGPGGTELATLRSSAPAYASPARRPTGTVPAAWYGRPSVLPVIAARPGWVRVRLQRRPDESTAWIQDRYVRFSSTPFRIVVNLAATRLSLYDHGRLVLAAPAGVGTLSDPTPSGQFFVAFDEAPPQPNPGYGPFIMVTSAHSRAISDWAGSGDAIIGIHGPIGASGEIGTTGARVSHGCVRLHVRSLRRLATVPPGTPVDIVR